MLPVCPGVSLFTRNFEAAAAEDHGSYYKLVLGSKSGPKMIAGFL